MKISEKICSDCVLANVKNILMFNINAPQGWVRIFKGTVLPVQHKSDEANAQSKEITLSFAIVNYFTMYRQSAGKELVPDSNYTQGKYPECAENFI